MSSPTGRKARLALAIVAALIALPVQASGAAAPADDEYVLKLPGVTQSESNVNDSGTNETSARHDQGGGGDSAAVGIQRGAVGEADAPPTPLVAAGDALTAVPASLLIGAGLLLVTALIAAGARRHRRPSAC
jgi:hypothetical protein